MSEEVSNSMDYESWLQQFEQPSELLEQITDQNRRFQEAQAFFSSDPEILDLAIEGLAEEQATTVDQLKGLNETDGAKREALGSYALSLEVKLSEAESGKAETEKAIKAQAEELPMRRQAIIEARIQVFRAEAAKILEQFNLISPKSLKKAEDLINSRAERAMLDAENSDPEIQALKESISELEELLGIYQADIDTMAPMAARIEQVGSEVWPMPLALHYLRLPKDEAQPEPETEKVTEVEEGTEFIIDEIPVDPLLISPEFDEVYNRIRQHHVDQPKASALTAAYLVTHPGEIVTVDELIEALYSHVKASVSSEALRSRVTTILGPMSNDLVLSVLKEEGLVLQYGDRKVLYTSSGGRTRVKTTYRIYRAVPENEAHVAKTIEHELDGVHYRDEIEAVKPQLTIQGSETKSKPSRARRTRKGLEASTEDWVKGFTRDVGSVLAQLESYDFLPESGGVKLIAIRDKFGRTISRQGIDRLIDAGVVKASILSGYNSGVEAIPLAAREAVLLIMFNGHQSILGKGSPKQREAVRMIETCISAFREHQKTKAKASAKTARAS